MRSVESKIPLLILLGPTAVGKTELAIALAESMDMEIVSADSRLFYRGMDIGTAKPSLEQRDRVPHHLIDVADPDDIWSLVRFQMAARSTITDIHQRHRLPLIVGGTGQYVRAISEGWDPPRPAARPRLRSALENWAAQIGEKGLHTRLAAIDSKAASKIDARNVRRVVRALEVTLSSGIPFSQQRRRLESPFKTLQIGLIRPRPELYARIDARIKGMLQAGWLNEVQNLLEKGFSPDLPSLSAIGYQQLVQHLQGQISLDEAVMRIQRASRAFVRRQANWFKPDDPNIHWFSVEGGTAEQIERFARKSLLQAE